MTVDVRLEALKAWLAGLNPERKLKIEPASSDASFRRYFRVSGYSGNSLIAMDAPPEQEDTAAFRAVAERLRQAGVRVPTILEADPAQGFLLLDDLGRETYLEAFSYRDPAPLMSAAVKALVQMQRNTPADGLPDFDRALLMRELNLFPEWYLGKELGIRPDPGLRRQLDIWFERLCERALAQPRVFVHRDYMPRNLMASDPAPGIIDFQDAVRGPISYDPVCLFTDAFYSFPAATVEAGLRDYHHQARAAGLPLPDSVDTFLSDCRWMGAQRHLKVIGIFARIAHRDGKRHYLPDIPRFFAYLRQAADAEPALAGLYELVGPWRPRSAMGARA
jgi:N-acetylmuramate 1-kinase